MGYQYSGAEELGGFLFILFGAIALTVMFVVKFVYDRINAWRARKKEASEE